jgi:hypothetical protein
METQLRLNGVPAIRIAAIKIRDYNKSVLMDCEGDQVWLPLSKIKIEDKTILIEEWLYNAKVEAGEL